MEEEDDDFTFPAAAAALPRSCQEDGLGLGLLWPRLPSAASTAATAAALWPFSSNSSSSSSGTAEEEDAPAASGGSSGRVAARRGEVGEGEEERMDMLWEHERAAAGEERMDLLWEDFNDELLLQLRRLQRAGSGGAAGTGAPSLADNDGRHSPPPADEEETSSSPGGGLYGCAPTMLRASSRAGAVGQFYGGRGRGGGRSRATGWELLLRLFRKLFAVDKSSPPPCQHHHRRRHGSIYVP
ncbi:uncharacterized protein LOC102720120 [Oryza brachyantha]|uniref:uncharacterized protein LOC102720120 n=1 Tax=Oryza brachyantha TaxID=4533 RepID=UPI001ADA33CD|nr:uncharacterized protein LOC102720120 [Oryza brachyantha]